MDKDRIGFRSMSLGDFFFSNEYLDCNLQKKNSCSYIVQEKNYFFILIILILIIYKNKNE